jgi:hypothetical protein
MMIHPVLGGLRPLFTTALLAAAVAAQSPLTFGNIFVVRVGDGTAPLTNGSVATFVEEYTPAGVLVQTLAMPVAPSGLNQPLTNSGTATSEGFLNVSANGIYLTLAGYSAIPGIAAVPQTTAAATPRVIGRIDLTGAVDTSTTITDGYNGAAGSNGNIRGAVSDDGSQFYTSGTGATASAGVRYVTLGGSTSVGLNSGAPTNCRVVGLYNGNLFTTSASTVYQGVCQVGTGLPTTPGNTVALLPGFPTTSGPSAYDFFFADPSTLYVADDRVNGSGGIQKWTSVGGTWTLQYVLAPNATTGCRGLSGFKFAGTTTLWATTTTNELVRVDDTGPTATFTTLATAATNTAFRGVRRLGRPSTLTRTPAACGTAGIFASGTGEVGTDVVTTVLNPAGFAFVGYGLTPLGIPFCNCTVLHEFSFLVGGPQHVLTLPNTPSLAGTPVLIQGLDFLAPGGCPDPLFTLTDGYSFLIQ